MATSDTTSRRATSAADREQMGFLFTEERAREEVQAARHIYAVGELVGQVRARIERDFASVWVEGEISNLRIAPSGHIYFTLKDGESQLPVVLFKRQASLLRFRPEDGLHALVRGKVTVYEQRGQMQLVAETLEPIGAGSLQLAFEQLRDRLAAEGLFADERKKQLPAFPRCVGVVTSPGGAVIQDFVNIAARRHAALDILLYPALVQGASAAAEIAAGIQYFNRARSVDVIVIARGGGSMEDLACFNSEQLARVIASSMLPVVSAVGHETDFTIADFVADLRAPTPSAAAELITAAQHRVEERVEELHHRLVRACRYQLMMASERFSRVSIATATARLRDLLARRQQRLDELQFRMESAFSRQREQCSAKVQQLTSALLRHDPSHKLRVQQELVRALESRLMRSMTSRLETSRSHQQHVAARLQGLSPLAVLGRGYAVVFSEDGKLLQDAATTRPGEQLTTRVAKGSFTSTVVESKL